MERMVNRRIKQYLEANELLDPRQHAFRQGFGTSTYFAELSNVLQEASDQGHHAEVISLDISKAFNRTWTPFVLRQLENWGIGGHTLHFVRNFLSGRSFRVVVGNTKSSSFAEETGVPQGSVLAVTLFLVAMNGVFDAIQGNIHIFVYADDILIVVVGPTPTMTRIRAQAAVKRVAKWASDIGFQLSASKSVRCHICPLGHKIKGPPITIEGQVIPLRKSIRILGVLLDRTLSFRQHFDAVKAACRTR
ncbi:hypothetical protein RP20_CCG005916 [Aedes albopictus]|nr:hypothetical protein RP20_CCG005916 [Aedes albopictus]